MAIKAVILCMTALFYVAHGYSSGAPVSACETLTPSHDNVVAQNKLQTPVTSPYFVDVAGGYTVENDGVVTMVLDGSQDFKGFVIVAEYIDGEGIRSRVGNWSSDHPSVRSACGDGSGLTHSDGSPKRGIEVRWTAPSAPFTGYASFWASFVQEKHTFWIEIQGTISVNVIPVTTTTSAPTTVTKDSLTPDVFPDPNAPSTGTNQPTDTTTKSDGGAKVPSNEVTDKTSDNTGSVYLRSKPGASKDENGASAIQISMLCIAAVWMTYLL